jgi:hypothetical protein
MYESVVVDILGGGCDSSNQSYTHGTQSFGAISAIRDNGVCVAGSGGHNTRVMGLCGSANVNNVENLVINGCSIISVSKAAITGANTVDGRKKLEELVINGTTVLVAALNQGHSATSPNGYHSIPGVIHVGRTWLDGMFWNYNVNSTVPNMYLDVLAMTDQLYRIGEGAVDACELSGAGTSIGTPVVAGVIALMKSVNSCLHPADIEEILVNTSQPIPANAAPGQTRGGLIDAYAAVLAAQNFQGIDRTLSGAEELDYYYVSGDLTIEQGADIKIKEKLMTGDNSRVIIESGAKLTIENAEGSFGNSSRIIVKKGGHLVVNGSTLSTDICASQWHGIIVEGNSNLAQQLPNQGLSNNQNGIVEIINHSIVENAKTAVSMDASHLPWPTVSQSRGGLLIADESTFRNMDRAFEFMKYSFKDNSRISNCTFDNLLHASTHWQNSGVVYDNCYFDNFQHEAIYSLDALVTIINGCYFDSDHQTSILQSSVDADFSFPVTFNNVEQYNLGMLGDGFLPNEFVGGKTGFYCNGCTTFDPIRIQNNIFFAQETGVYFEGVGNYYCDKNDFISCGIGSRSVSNGNLDNVHENNNYSSNDVGLFYYFDNSGSTFLTNCFNSSFGTDIRMHGAYLRDDIGGVAEAGSNEFSAFHTERRISITDGVQTPTYHLIPSRESNALQDRYVPREGSEIYSGCVFFSLNETSTNCGSSLTPGPVTALSYTCVLPNTCAELETYINNFRTILAQNEVLFEASTPYTSDWYKYRIRIYDLNVCLRKAIIKQIRLDCFNRNYEVAKGVVEAESFIIKSYLIGFMMSQEDYQDALQYLNELQVNTNEEYDFVYTQRLNVKRMEDELYIPSSAELDSLLLIGNKYDPMCAYARSLYRYFTGQKIVLNLPEPNGAQQAKGVKQIRLDCFNRSFTKSVSTMVGNKGEFRGYI